MLTKYYLHIGKRSYELRDDDLMNWDQIQCSYKRAGYDGIVRSFTSEFEFVNRARELMLGLYLDKRFDSEASISVYTQNDLLEFEKRFECPLDFSTVEWDSYTFKISSLDNSLSSLVKANKSTSYDFCIGEDIYPDCTFLFSRLPIQESLTYAVTGGESDEDDGSLYVPASENNRVFCGVTCDEEIYINRVISWNDNQDMESGSYMLEAVNDVKVNIEVSIDYDQCYELENAGMSCAFVVTHKDGTEETVGGTHGSFVFGFTANKHFCGTFSSEADLRAKYPRSSLYTNGAPRTDYWAIVDGIVWGVHSYGSAERTDWECEGVTADEYRRKTVSRTLSVELKYKDKVSFHTSGPGAHIYSSSIKFSWITKGEPCRVSAFRPETIAQALLRKICDGKIIPRVFISDFDNRLPYTLLLASESIRDIKEAKLHTSFNEFCDWMSAVFGYVYYIGDECDSEFTSYREALGGYLSTTYPLTDEDWSVGHTESPAKENIVYFECYGKFAAFDGKKWHSRFPGVDGYNDPNTGLARTDTIFKLNRSGASGLYYFGKNPDGSLDRVAREYHGEIDDIYNRCQSVHFVHRSEIFRHNAPVHIIANACDIKYSIDTSSIYSAVTAGYDKKDYSNINGRDEFNFSNTYTTGCTASDKTLTLVSKYRADSYGIEFAAQKRGAESTDSTSDKDVFFVLCKKNQDGMYVPDMAYVIEGALSSNVFNGAFCPMACVRANAGLIGLQSGKILLKFASSTANSSIVVGGEPMSADIKIDSPIATCGSIEFSTGEVDELPDVDSLIEVNDNGTVYRGFVKEADFKYARTEAVKYKLIIKDIEL